MGKYKLTLEPDYDFELIGISSHDKDYRLCWAIKNTLNIDFRKTNSLEIKTKIHDKPAYFSLFGCDDKANYREYYLLSNLSENISLNKGDADLFGNATEKEWIVPEQKQMNYFFIIKGEVDEYELREMVDKIKGVEFVLTANPIEVTSLKSKANLIF